MSTILQETMDIMRDECLAPSEVCFVGLPDEEYDCTWDDFVEMAKDASSCMNDLEIHFKDGDRLIRNVEDGGWLYMKPPVKGCTASFRKLTTLNIHKFSTEKKELLELSRLKKKYES